MKTKLPIIPLTASLFASLLALNSHALQDEQISVVQTQAPREIGRIFVLGAKSQSIDFEFSQSGPRIVAGRLYQMTCATMAPVTEAFEVKFDKNSKASVPIEFPAVDQAMEYRLIFQTKSQQYLRISYIPSSELLKLRSLTAKSPLLLKNPSQELKKALSNLSLKFRTIIEESNTATTTISWATPAEQTPDRPTQKKRKLVVNPSLNKCQEIWIAKGKTDWILQVHPSTLTDAQLITPTGQARLIHLLTFNPLQTNL